MLRKQTRRTPSLKPETLKKEEREGRGWGGGSVCVRPLLVGNQVPNKYSTLGITRTWSNILVLQRKLKQEELQPVGCSTAMVIPGKAQSGEMARSKINPDFLIESQKRDFQAWKHSEQALELIALPTRSVYYRTEPSSVGHKAKGCIYRDSLSAWA